MDSIAFPLRNRLSIRDTASVFMEMRSWPQPVKDRESVLLRRAVSRHTPRRMATDRPVHLFRQKDLVGPPYPSPHPLRFPSSSIKLDPNSRDRAEKIIFPTGRVSALTISFPPSPRLESNSLSPRKNAQRVNSILVHPFPRVPPADTRCSNDAHVGHVSLRCEDSLREGRGSIVIFYNVSFGTHDEPV